MSIRIIFTSLAILIHINSVANDTNEFYQQIEYARTNSVSMYNTTQFIMGCVSGVLTPIAGACIGCHKLKQIYPKVAALEQKDNVNTAQLKKYHALKITESRSEGLIVGSILSVYLLIDFYSSMAAHKLKADLERR